MTPPIAGTSYANRLANCHTIPLPNMGRVWRMPLCTEKQIRKTPRRTPTSTVPVTTPHATTIILGNPRHLEGEQDPLLQACLWGCLDLQEKGPTRSEKLPSNIRAYGILVKRITKAMTPGVLNIQHGALSGNNTTTLMAKLVNYLHKSEGYPAVLEVAKAFPSVPHSRIHERESPNCPCMSIRI